MSVNEQMEERNTTKVKLKKKCNDKITTPDHKVNDETKVRRTEGRKTSTSKRDRIQIKKTLTLLYKMAD